MGWWAACWIIVHSWVGWGHARFCGQTVLVFSAWWWAPGLGGGTVGKCIVSQRVPIISVLSASLLHVPPSFELYIYSQSFWTDINMNICIVYVHHFFSPAPDCNKPESQTAVEIGLHRFPLVWPFGTRKRSVRDSFIWLKGGKIRSLHQGLGSNKMLHGYKISRFPCALYELVCLERKYKKLWRGEGGERTEHAWLSNFLSYRIVSTFATE